MPIEEDASQLNAGLPIRVDEVCGRNRYVSGADWAEFLRARTVSKQIDETA
jgi:hypothetical protein